MNDIARKNLSERTIAMNKARMKNYDGYKFEHLKVIRRDHRDEKGRYWFLCQCDCGKEFYIRGADIGKTKSCGCMTKEYQFKTHGESKTRLYAIWRHMNERCYKTYHKSYADYGGRGITVCPEWRYDYVAFRNWAYANGYNENAGYMECTLDRIDVNGNYEPENCRWISMKEQCNNRRNNRMLECDGIRRTMMEWSEITGIQASTLWHRWEKGWSDEKIIKTPLRKQKNNRGADE